MSQGLFSRSGKLERSKVKSVQLNEKSYWRQTSCSTSRRSKRLPALNGKEDLMHTLSSCVLWMTLSKENPSLCVSYKLFDRWVHKPVAVHIEHWTYNEDDDVVSCVGDVSPKNFRLIDRLMSYLIPQLEKLTIDMTWHPALHNPKLDVKNMNTVTIHSTIEGVEFVCSDGMTAFIDLNVKDAVLQLVTGNHPASCCLNQKIFTVSSLSDAIGILEMTTKMELQDVPSGQLSPRKRNFVKQTLCKLDVTKDVQENEQALQQILCSMSPQSSLQSGRVACLWIQYGTVPCLMSLLLDPTKHRAHALFQNIKNVCKAMIIYEEELASKAIILYICRALQQYGLQCRPILVLLSFLIDIPDFRKIAIEQFDLGQNFGRLLLVHGPHTQAEMTSLNPSGFHTEHEISVPPMYIINEQLQLPVMATAVWRVPPLPMRRNPPEQPLAQISILKNLLLLSPLNNNDVEFRSGHLTAMLLAFLDRGLMEKFQEHLDLHPISGQEMDSCRFFVMRLIMANVHEHTHAHPVHATFSNVPRLHACKAKIDIKPIDAFIRQVLETLPESQDGIAKRMGYRLLTDLVTSTPSSTIADLTIGHWTRFLSSFRTEPTSTDFESDVKESTKLTVFTLMEALLRRTRPFSEALLHRCTASGIVGGIFRTLEGVQERRELECIDEEDASVWMQRCWKLLEALIKAGRSFDTTGSTDDLEDQLAREFHDPSICHITDGNAVLAMCKFLSVYLDAPGCRLYVRPIFPKLLKHLKEILNKAWNRRDMASVVEILNVVGAVAGHASDNEMPTVRSFLEGLLMTLNWVTPEDFDGRRRPESDRTVPFLSSPVSDWMQSCAGSSRGKKHSEIQPTMDDTDTESMGSRSKMAFVRKPKGSPIATSLRSFPLETDRPSTEADTVHRLEKFRSRHRLENDRSRDAAVPKLDLGILWYAKEHIPGRHSVASTVYSSEYPVRPVSQMTDRSGMLEGQRQGCLLTGDSDRTPLKSSGDTSIFRSDLYSETVSPDPNDTGNASEIPKSIDNPDVRRVKYFRQHRRRSLSSDGSTESTSNICLDPPNERTSIETVGRIGRRDSESIGLRKVHSCDDRRTSLAMKHLIGYPTPDDDHPIGRRGNRSIPSIVFSGRTSNDGPNIDSVVTVYDSSENGGYGLALDMTFGEEESISSCPTESSRSSRYRLTPCDDVLEQSTVHAAALKTLVGYVAAEYRKDKREQTLTKVIALGLHRHFRHVPISVLMSVRDWAVQHSNKDNYTLLKMLAKRFFDGKLYPSIQRIGRGVFSSIHACSCHITGGPTDCCVKVIDVPTDPYGMRSIRDLFGELTVLQKLQKLPNVVRLYDFGTFDDNFHLVMKRYSMDLLTWRQHIVGSSIGCSKMMFVIFLKILKGVEAVHDAGFVHFDLKCSNVLLDGPTDDLYRLTEGTSLPFDLVLADFGEAMSIEDAGRGLQRSRGTQAFMSPEMLVSGGGNKRCLPGTSSDIWSLGCLLFELVTGEVLFDDSDYSEFHMRLTKSNRSLIDAWKIQTIPKAIREPVLLCLSYLLVRNPSLRAPLHAVTEWIEHLLDTDVLPVPYPIVHRPKDDSSFKPKSVIKSDRVASWDFRSGRDRWPLSSDVCLLNPVAAKDPWCLAGYRITHVVYIRSVKESEEVSKDLRNAVLRANGLMFEILVSTASVDGMSWIDHCRGCCRCISLSRRPESKIAVVAGRDVGCYVGLTSRYLTEHDGCLNLDSGLLM